MSDMEQTRVMGAAGATMQMPAGGADAFRTQMGGVISCPICQSSSPLSELYCGECGFLLASAPPVEIVPPTEEAASAELVDVTDGRRYRLRPGVNTLGRMGTDILLSESTISRNHAKLTVAGDTVTIEDLGSSNGTKVGDQRLSANQPVAATHGTPLRFGNWRVMLEVAGKAAIPSNEPTVMVGEHALDRTIVEAVTRTEDTLLQVPIVSVTPAVESIPAVENRPNPPESAEPPIARLERSDGPASDIAIPMGTVTIGRKAGNTVVINGDSFVSGRHAEIATDNTGSYLADLGSTNGTVINGEKMTPHEKQLLLEGDEVQLGQSRFTFRLVMEEDETSQELADAETRMDSEGDSQASHLPQE